MSFQIRNEAFFFKIKEIKGLRVPPTWREQVIPLIDEELAEKDHFWMETN